MTSIIRTHDTCADSQPDLLCAYADGMPDNEYVFTLLDLPDDGTCSVITSINDSLINNSAALTGGAIYSTHVPSLNVTCPSGQQLDPVHGCASWTGNQVHTVETGFNTFAEGYSPHIFACNVVQACVVENIWFHMLYDGVNKQPAVTRKLLCAALAVCLVSLTHPLVSLSIYSVPPPPPPPPPLKVTPHRYTFDCLLPCACIHIAC